MSATKFDVLSVGLMGNPTPTPWDRTISHFSHAHTACQIKCSRQDGRLVTGGQGRGRGRQTHGGVLPGGPTDRWLQRLAKTWRPTSKETNTEATCLYLDVRVPIESRENCFPPGKFISRELTSLFYFKLAVRKYCSHFIVSRYIRKWQIFYCFIGKLSLFLVILLLLFL